MYYRRTIMDSQRGVETPSLRNRRSNLRWSKIKVSHVKSAQVLKNKWRIHQESYNNKFIMMIHLLIIMKRFRRIPTTDRQESIT